VPIYAERVTYYQRHFKVQFLICTGGSGSNPERDILVVNDLIRKTVRCIEYLMYIGPCIILIVEER